MQRERFQKLCVCFGLAAALADDGNAVDERAPKSPLKIRWTRKKISG
jgi:hypothetical protein